MVFLHALQGILSLQIIVSIAYVLARKGWFSPCLLYTSDAADE